MANQAEDAEYRERKKLKAHWEIILTEDARLALRLLAKAPENTLLMLPCGLDNALRELEYHGLSESTETMGVRLASITLAGRGEASRV
jgi:hypothetical protein